METLILGDFNAPVIDWQARSCSAIGSFPDHLLEFAEMGHLFQGITFPTCFRAGTFSSILDLAFFSVPDAFSSVSSLSQIGLTDHAVVKILIKWQTPSNNEPLRPRRWNYHKLNTAKLTALAGELSWSETTKDDSIEVQWANIQSVVLSLRDKTVPFAPSKKLSSTPWFRKKHKRAKARKDRAYALLMKYNTQAHLTVFNKESARLHQMLRSSRYYYEKRLALTTSNSPKPFFVYVRRRR